MRRLRPDDALVPPHLSRTGLANTLGIATDDLLLGAPELTELHVRVEVDWLALLAQPHLASGGSGDGRGGAAAANALRVAAHRLSAASVGALALVLRTGAEHEPGSLVQTCVTAPAGDCRLDV